MLDTVRDAIYDFFFLRPQRKRDARAPRPAWTAIRLGEEVVFFDNAWAVDWYKCNAGQCTTGLAPKEIATHFLRHLDEYQPSMWIKRLHDNREKIARKMASTPSERMAYHTLNFAFSTNDTDLLVQVANWARTNPSRWFNPSNMNEPYPDDFPGDETCDLGDKLCLFARLFSSVHVMEWLFQHAPDLKHLVREPSAWEQLLDTMHENPSHSKGSQIKAVNSTAEDNNKTFQIWPLIASQCFGHRVPPVLPERQRDVRMGRYETLRAHMHNPAAQCYYLRQNAKDGNIISWGPAMEPHIANQVVLDFSLTLLVNPILSSSLTLHSLQLSVVNQVKDDVEFYYLAEKVFNDTLIWSPASDVFENQPPVDGKLFE